MTFSKCRVYEAQQNRSVLFHQNFFKYHLANVAILGYCANLKKKSFILPIFVPLFFCGLSFSFVSSSLGVNERVAFTTCIDPSNLIKLNKSIDESIIKSSP